MEPLETDGNLSVPLKPLLVERLPWLFEDLGFRLTHSDYDPAHFGNSIAILDSEALRLGFVRDRGQVMLDVAALAEPEGWYGLWSLYEAMHNERIKPRYTLNAVGGLLKQEFSALVEALGPKLHETQKEIERLKIERLRALGIRQVKP
jgi:hypothetical protein